MKQKRKQWKQQEKEVLKKIYPTASWDEMIDIFQTSKECITHKAKQLGIKREMVNFVKYSPEEITYIKDNYGKVPSKFIAEKLGRTASAIETKAKRLKLGTKTYWTEEEIELLKKVFPMYGNEELSEIYLKHKENIYYSKKGDICLSIMELMITNFLIDNSINYNKEELYKDVFKIQDFGIKRMDWRLEDNTVIEYFGMMNNEEYKKSALEKIDLCKKYNINLIELYPENIKDLKNILKEYIK